MLNGGDPVDLITIGWVNPYIAAAASGGLRPLDDLLPRYAPKLWAKNPRNIWDAALVNGKIYQAIN